MSFVSARLTGQVQAGGLARDRLGGAGLSGVMAGERARGVLAGLWASDRIGGAAVTTPWSSDRLGGNVSIPIYLHERQPGAVHGGMDGRDRLTGLLHGGFEGRDRLKGRVSSETDPDQADTLMPDQKIIRDRLGRVITKEQPKR